MSDIKFYYNSTSLESERNRLFSNKNILENRLRIYAIGTNYIFDENHFVTNIDAGSISNSLLENNSVRFINKDNILILDADDITFLNLRSNIITGFVICSDEKPLFMITNLDEMPYTINGEKLIINFSNAYEKILAFNLEKYIIGSVLITTEKFISTNVPTEIIRNSLRVSRNEELNKSGLSGKDAAYKDISITGRPHPLSGDLVSVSGNSAITQSLRNILLANTYDRPFSSKDIAGNINAFLFEFADDITNSELKTGIAIAITNYEPRISIVDITVKSDPQSYSLIATIIYIIKTTNKTQEFSILLERA